MCEPIRCVQGGMWFGRNHNFADATFVDYGAADAFAVAAANLPELVKALEYIAQRSITPDSGYSVAQDMRRTAEAALAAIGKE